MTKVKEAEHLRTFSLFQKNVKYLKLWSRFPVMCNMFILEFCGHVSLLTLLTNNLVLPNLDDDDGFSRLTHKVLKQEGVS